MAFSLFTGPSKAISGDNSPAILPLRIGQPDSMKKNHCPVIATLRLHEPFNVMGNLLITLFDRWTAWLPQFLPYSILS
jgi:hypothetical protein